MSLSPMGFQILLSLKDEPLDAEGIARRMRQLGEKREPPIASFYRSLKKALEAGHLEIEDRAPEAQSFGEPGRSCKGRGRPAQRYRITRSGKSALAGEARRLGRLAQLALSEVPAAEHESRGSS